MTGEFSYWSHAKENIWNAYEDCPAFKEMAQAAARCASENHLPREQFEDQLYKLYEAYGSFLHGTNNGPDLSKWRHWYNRFRDARLSKKWGEPKLDQEMLSGAAYTYLNGALRVPRMDRALVDALIAQETFAFIDRSAGGAALFMRLGCFVGPAALIIAWQTFFGTVNWSRLMATSAFLLAVVGIFYLWPTRPRLAASNPPTRFCTWSISWATSPGFSSRSRLMLPSLPTRRGVSSYADTGAVGIGQRDISGVFMVPTQFARLFDLPQAELDRRRDHHLTSIISNAAALPFAIKERVIAQFGPGLLHETYGSTEGGIVTNIRPTEQLSHPGSVGRPFPGVEIDLRDDHGRSCGPDEAGELFSRSPASFSGYWQLPEETAEAVHDGWVTVGDIARRDGDGFIVIIDRKKDMVVTGGLNVYPREIENVIASLASVQDVAVVGRNDAQWGEALHVFVVTRAGTSLDAEAITRKCRAELAGFKVPRGVTFLDELPRNASGKVLKTSLRSMANELGHAPL